MGFSFFFGRSGLIHQRGNKQHKVRVCTFYNRFPPIGAKAKWVGCWKGTDGIKGRGGNPRHNENANIMQITLRVALSLHERGEFVEC